jgi:N-acetylmuramoyl-L-alanine amidase
VTWHALVEASWQLGDRVLQLRTPNLRGDDVAELQEHLGRLGFDTGRVDGIFGRDTAGAVAEFQRNVALTVDGICGPETVRALGRLRGRRTPGQGVSVVREYERLSRGERTLAGRRVVVGRLGEVARSAPAPQAPAAPAAAESGAVPNLGAEPVTGSGTGTEPAAAPVAELGQIVGRALRLLGSNVLTLDKPDESFHASAANNFGADVYVGLRGAVGPSGVAYYATSGFESLGGHRLADLLTVELTETMAAPLTAPVGMRLPVLRETRMPAVLVELGPPSAIEAQSASIAAALARALARWIAAPVPVEPR